MEQVEPKHGVAFTQSPTHGG